MTDWFSLCARVPVGGHQGFFSQVLLKTSPQKAVHSWQILWAPCRLQNTANTSMAFAGCLILDEWIETSLSLSSVHLNSQTQPLRCMWPLWLQEEYDNLGRFFKSLEYQFLFFFIKNIECDKLWCSSTVVISPLREQSSFSSPPEVCPCAISHLFPRQLTSGRKLTFKWLII